MQAAEPRSKQSKTLLEAVATEIGWDSRYSPDGLMFMGACPVCRERMAFAWDYRLARRNKTWGCAGCGAGGDLLNLWQRARQAA